MTPQKIADTFVGMAAKAPNNQARADILRRGAATFADMASSPEAKDPRVKSYLTTMGLNFAGAAAEAQQAQNSTTSDFTQLMRDTAEAYRQLGPEESVWSQASMSALAQMPNVTQAQDPNSSPRVSIAPATFNVNATLGRSVTVKYNPSPEEITAGIQQSQTVAFWQGKKEEAQAMTVDIGTVAFPTPRPHAVPRPSARPYAQILYGSDGNTQNTVTLDVGLGRRITVVGNYISVLVGMDPPLSTTGVTQPAQAMSLGASIGAFAAHSQAPIFRSVYFDDLDSGGVSEFFPIPLRADLLWPPVPTASPGIGGAYTGVIQVFFYDFGGTPIGQWTWDFSTPHMPIGAVPVPPDAFVFAVSTTVNNTFMRVPFQLSL